MIRFPLQTPRERWLAVALLAAWALLYLPNLRTNPNWYSDEGEVMEMSWTAIHGNPHIGPLRNNFLYPHGYPPLYLLANGLLLRVFGNDIVVGRAFQAVCAAAGAALLFWVGTRLRDRTFGFLSAAVFLVYPETVMNFRWVRPHPVAGVLALAVFGFVVRYLQEKRTRDIVWAGLLATLAGGVHYYAYPLLILVVATAAVVKARDIGPALAATAVFPVGFALWFAAVQPGGFGELIADARLLGGYAPGGTSLVAQAARLYHNIVSFGLLTPTLGEQRQFTGVDVWLIVATLGVVTFPALRFRKWLAVWLLGLMYPVFKQQDNVSIFFYPAMMFLPLLALGCAGGLVRLQDWFGACCPKVPQPVRWAPAALLLAVLGIISLQGATGHFRTKVDPWTVSSVADAEAAMSFVNAHTTTNDFVVVSKILDWLVVHARKGSLIQSLAYEGRTNEVYVTPVPRELFQFDCRWQNAKYLVLAYGRFADGRVFGFDGIYTMGLTGVREIMQTIQTEKWPVAFQNGEFLVLSNPRFVK